MFPRGQTLLRAGEPVDIVEQVNGLFNGGAKLPLEE